MEVASFDVFDTLLTRTVAVPRDLFLALGEALRDEGLVRDAPPTFAALRAQAESAARRKTPGGEVNLEEIYRELGARLGWSPAQQTAAAQRELQVEQQHLRPVPGALDLVRQARARGCRVLFLSDMYLPATFLEEALRAHGFWREGDRLHVSGATRCSKASGDLYRKLQAEMGPVTAWTHCGDDARADVAVPRGLGLQVAPGPPAVLTAHERLVRGSEAETTLWRSRLAGAMRLARLDGLGRTGHARAVWDSGANVVGPLLFGFVRWCLEAAQARGIQRLYFVARDGQILLRIAEKIVAAWRCPVECRYLYGSRQAWHLAAVDRFTDEDLAWVLLRTKDLSVDQVFKRLHGAPDLFRSELEPAGFPASHWQDSLTPEALERLRTLFQRPDWRAAIEARARDVRGLAERYLRQEGLFDDLPWAMVDIGWFGRLQRSLAAVLSLCGHPRAGQLTGFYFGLKGEERFSPEQRLFAYWNQWPDLAEVLHWPTAALFEMFTAADHGSVTGYAESGGRMVPVLQEPANVEAVRWGLPLLQESVLAFVSRGLDGADRGLGSAVEYLRVTGDLFLHFYGRPTREEAAAWGSFRMSDEQVEEHFRQMIPEWNGRQILAAVFDPGRRWYWWPEGHAALNPNLALRFFVWLKRAKRRFTRPRHRAAPHRVAPSQSPGGRAASATGPS